MNSFFIESKNKTEQKQIKGASVQMRSSHEIH